MTDAWGMKLKRIASAVFIAGALVGSQAAVASASVTAAPSPATSSATTKSYGFCKDPICLKFTGS